MKSILIYYEQDYNKLIHRLSKISLIIQVYN